jgi:hypothetical protein
MVVDGSRKIAMHDAVTPVRSVLGGAGVRIFLSRRSCRTRTHEGKGWCRRGSGEGRIALSSLKCPRKIAVADRLDTAGKEARRLCSDDSSGVPAAKG